MHCIYIYFAVVFINIDQDFLSDPYCPYCYEMLSNHFQKSITSIKILFSLNSTTKMHQFQKFYFIWLFKIIYALNIYNLHCLFNILTMSFICYLPWQAARVTRFYYGKLLLSILISNLLQCILIRECWYQLQIMNKI